jgi:hypothetical protein
MCIANTLPVYIAACSNPFLNLKKNQIKSNQNREIDA